VSQAKIHDLAVVGGGIAGLAAAWRACRAGHDVVLLEEADRLGGVIETVTRGPYRIERAASTIPSSARHLLALLASLPSPPQAVPALAGARRQLLLTPGGLEPVPRTPPALLATRLLGVGERVRALLELTRAPRRGVASETLYAFVRRRFGAGVADAFLVPFTSGVYGAHPRRLGAADAFPSLVALERRRGGVLKGLRAEAEGTGRQVLLLEGGMESLPRALGAALGARARTAAAVRTLAPRPEHVDLTLASGETVAAREVVLATSPARQAALVEGFAPPVAECLDAVRPSPIAIVALGLPPGNPRVPDAFGFLRGRRSGARVLGATFHSRLTRAVAPEGHELVLVFLGGSEDPGALDLPDDVLVEHAVAGLSQALGGRVTPDMVDVKRWPRAIPLFAPGHRGRMAAAQAALARHRIALSGSHVTGVGLDACCRAGL
jgi:oxygen-dependent protoporphyrinogen oxidase